MTPTGLFNLAGTPTSFVDVTTTDTTFGTRSGSYPVRATTGTQLVRQEVHLDDRGNTDLTTDYGRIQSGWGVNTLGPADVPVLTQSDFSSPVGTSAGAWIWKPRSVKTFTGAAASPTFARAKSLSYDAQGNPNEVFSILTGTLPLAYHHEVAGAAIASQPPTKAAENGQAVEFMASVIDAYGNVSSFSTGGGTQCTNIVYDPVFRLVPTQTSFGCTSQRLTTTVLTYDLGIEKVTTLSGVHNDVSTFTYDELGRLKEAFEPDPAVPGMAALANSILMQYIEDPSAHVFRTHAFRHTGEIWQISDALGTTLATFHTADRSNGDTGDWVACRRAWSARRTGSFRSLIPRFFWTGAPPANLPGEAITASNLGQVVTHDAFGRVLSQTQTDGHTIQQQTVFHALSAVISDAEDLADGRPALPGPPRQSSKTALDKPAR